MARDGRDIVPEEIGPRAFCLEQLRGFGDGLVLCDIGEVSTAVGFQAIVAE